MTTTFYQPSYDFRLFDIPFFSALQAQEFGADTVFQAGDPTWYVDYSLDSLFGLGGGAFFQGVGQTRAEIEAEVARRQAEYERARDVYRRQSVNIGDILRGRTARSGEGTGPIVGDKEIVSDGPGTMKESKAGEQIKEWLKTLPAGSGSFVIAVVVVILLLLFVRR